ncbi:MULTISPECIES: GNAT family N-acetyltransferase [unclassified Streptomyces]|uniref:GNAT family N-acetyltransferase n=1 Tax=unclassified Streptomyces TaxID=2593676 RepID=UPI003803D156
MPMTNTPKTATLDDAAQISRSLALAFDDDPMMRSFFPAGSSRQASLVSCFTTISTRQYVPGSVCERTGSAAAFWVPPEAQAKAMPDAETIQELLNILGDRAGLFKETIETAAAHRPEEPHWYLALIGADPAAQGQGQGAALLRSGPAKAGAAGLPAYLESSKAANLPFYGYFGFTVREEVRLTENGPTLWAMWREPHRPADA